MKDEEIVTVVGRRYKILKILYPNSEYALIDLATKIKVDQGNLSRYVVELEDWRLIETRKEEREKGRPFKYIKLTLNARRIVNSMIMAVQPSRDIKSLEWQLNEILYTMTNSAFSNGLRKAAEEIFFSFCKNYLSDMIENDSVRKLFEKVVAHPTQYGEKLKASITDSFNHLLDDKKWCDWVSGKLYPLLVQHMENRETDVKVRVWAIEKVGDAARHDKEGADDELIELMFANDVDFESELGKEVRRQLISLATINKKVFEKIRKKAKSKDPVKKAKAERLLKDIIYSWSPRLQE